MLGRKQLWTPSYADDVALAASNEIGLKRMIRRFKRYFESYLQKSGSEVSTDKTTFMTCRKAGRRRKKI